MRPEVEQDYPEASHSEAAWFHSVQAYANSEVYESPEYNELGKVYEAENDLFAQLYLEKGVANAIMRIRTIRKLEDKTLRTGGLTLKEQAMKRMDNGGIPAVWMTRMLMWNQQDDPGGIDVLRELKVSDTSEVMRGVGSFDAVQEYDRQKYADAMVATEELVISFYERQRFPERFLESEIIFQS